MDQLQAKGKSQELMLRFAQDAQTWSDLRKTWITQRRTLVEFASEYCARHNSGRGLGPLLKRIGEINSRVIERLDGLDQAVRDMLQLVSISHTILEF